MLPDSLRQYLEGCDKKDTGKILRTIAELTEKSNFEYAVKTVETALLYQAYDVDSLVNLYSRLHGQVLELPPITLAPQVPRLKPGRPDLAAYDKCLNRRGGDSVSDLSHP
jgi:hypothetical protein